MPEQHAGDPAIRRVRRSKDEARSSYDKLSGWYDLLAAGEQRIAARGMACLAPAAGERILEIGYGTGQMLVLLARAVGDGGRVYGLDLSTGMRAMAERRLRSAGLSGRVELVTGDGSSLPFDAASMQAVFMSFTLELFDTPEIPGVLQECRRVLVPGGRICVVAMAARQPPGLASRVYEWAHERFLRAVDCRPIRLRESLKGAGFTIARLERAFTWGLPLDICLARM